jgi:hypothetical protein
VNPEQPSAKDAKRVAQRSALVMEARRKFVLEILLERTGNRRGADAPVARSVRGVVRALFSKYNMTFSESTVYNDLLSMSHEVVVKKRPQRAERNPAAVRAARRDREICSSFRGEVCAEGPASEMGLASFMAQLWPDTDSRVSNTMVPSFSPWHEVCGKPGGEHSTSQGCSKNFAVHRGTA